MTPGSAGFTYVVVDSDGDSVPAVIASMNAIMPSEEIEWQSAAATATGVVLSFTVNNTTGEIELAEGNAWGAADGLNFNP